MKRSHPNTDLPEYQRYLASSEKSSDMIATLEKQVDIHIRSNEAEASESPEHNALIPLTEPLGTKGEVDVEPLVKELNETVLSRSILRYQSSAHFETIQKWEGIVEEIFEDHFVARLYDLTADISDTIEEADIQIDDVNLSDRVLIEEGAIFYLTLGKERHKSGRIQKVSRIRFKRVPPMSEEDLNEVLDQSNQYKHNIRWE